MSWSEETSQIIRDKCQRCLEIWEDVGDGLASEKDFIREREGLYRIVLRIAKRDLDASVLGLKEIRKVKDIKTSRDVALRERIDKGCLYADGLLNDKNVKAAAEALEKVEAMHKWMDRPHSMFDIFVGKDMFGNNEPYLVEHDLEEF